MAPEVLAQSKYGRKGDIWAVGCTMIQMLTGQPPWKDRNLHSMVQLHLLLQGWNGPPAYDQDAVSEGCRATIAACFQHSSSNRPTAEELSEYAFLRPDDLGNSWDSQQLGMSGDLTDGLHSGGGNGAGGADDEPDLGGSMQDLMSQINKIAGQDSVQGLFRSVDNSESNNADETMRVAVQLAGRQRSREQQQQQREQRESKAAGGDEASLPPSRYTPPRPAPGGNPYARGANGSRPKELQVAAPDPRSGSRPTSQEEARDARDGRDGRSGRTSNPGSKPTTPQTPQSRSGSAAATPTRTHPKASSATPPRGQQHDPAEDANSYLSLRVVTSGVRHEMPAPLGLKITPKSGAGVGEGNVVRINSAGSVHPGGAGSAAQVARSSSAGAGVGRSQARGERGLGSARDGEITPKTPHTPHTPQDRPVETDDDVYRPVEAGEDGELAIAVNWSCQYCGGENSPYQTKHCDHCAKVRVQKIVHDFAPTRKTSPTKSSREILAHSIYK